MSDSVPRTAAEVRACLDKMLADLSPMERLTFWHDLESHPDNAVIMMGNVATKTMLTLESAVKTIVASAAKVSELHRKLQPYRKAPNAKKNSEILRLDSEGKTAGQIRRLIRPAFGDMSESAIRSVILRARKKKSK